MILPSTIIKILENTYLLYKEIFDILLNYKMG